MIETKEQIQARVDRAVELFKSGYNCSQAVVTAFADGYGYTEEQALLMAASFGGGIGRMRQTCGAACGLFMLAGLETGATQASDRAGKSANYALVQDLAAQFKELNGSTICADLLGLTNGLHNDPQAAERTATYYKKRPCVKMVESAAQLWADYLLQKEERKEV